MKSGLAAQLAKSKWLWYELTKVSLVKVRALPPQLQLIVVVGLQYAVLAKRVNGLKDEI
jgi:hypothetical protein